MYFIFFIKWKTGNQLTIHLVRLLAGENEYIDDSFDVVLSQKIYNIFIKKLLQIWSAKIN